MGVVSEIIADAIKNGKVEEYIDFFLSIDEVDEDSWIRLFIAEFIEEVDIWPHKLSDEYEEKYEQLKQKNHIL